MDSSLEKKKLFKPNIWISLANQHPTLKTLSLQVYISEISFFNWLRMKIKTASQAAFLC